MTHNFMICIFLFLALIPSNAHSIAIDDTMKIRTADMTNISPDGSAILFVLTTPKLTSNGYEEEIYHVEASGGEIRRLAQGSMPKWSPDGAQFGFLSRTETGAQIFLMRTGSEQPVQLTKLPSSVQDFYWSPDSTRIAYFTNEFLTSDADGPREIGKESSRTRIYTIDIKSSKVTQVTKGDFTTVVHPWNPGANLSWSPDGKKIAFAKKPNSTFEGDFYSDIAVVSVDSGAILELVSRPGADLRPKWSPDGKQIAFVSSFGKIDRLASFGFSIVPAAGGTPRDAGVKSEIGFLDGPFSFDWSADSQEIYFESIFQTTIQLFSLQIRTGEIHQLTNGQKVYLRFSFSQNRKRMAFLASDPERPWEIYVSSTVPFQPKRVTDLNPWVFTRHHTKTDIFRWQNKEGTEMEGLLIKPSDSPATRKYPLLVYVHGGPEGVALSSFDSTLPFPLAGIYDFPLKAFATQGYCIFLPNFRGSGGYGEKFRRDGYQKNTLSYIDDILSGVDAVIASGVADDRRIGVMGWASGAHKVAMLITRTDRFQAAAFGGGPTNLISVYGQNDFPISYDSYYSGPPWQSKHEYELHSPIYMAHKVKTPTLMMHGENDFLIPWYQSKEFHTVLARHNVPVTFLVYPRQGHSIYEPKLSIDAANRTLAWFDRWLKGNKISSSAICIQRQLEY